MSSEILIVPKNGQGHLFPCMQLCNHLLQRNFTTTVLVTEDISGSIPVSLLESSLFKLLNVSPPSSLPPPTDRRQASIHQKQQLAQGVEAFLEKRSGTDTPRPVCAIMDHIMFRSGTQDVCAKFGIPTITFITSGACWAAVQHAAWVVKPDDMKPGEVRALPGLPKEMVLKYSDLKQRMHWNRLFPGAGKGGPMPRMGPPLPGEPAMWAEEVKSSVAIIVNTCDDLERPFIDYMANLAGKPVWGMGPLLPDEYWRSSDSLLKERGIRPNRESNYSEDEIIQWMDEQPRGSVIYVSFGSEVNPSMEEYPELTKALEETARPFIWVIQKKSSRTDQPNSETYFPHGLDSKVGRKGLIIHGWAPQLLILSHPSIGAFVSHCGWNSTVEAVVRGVPFITWPIRGDQYYNAMLLVNHLKIGVTVCERYPAEMVKKDHILEGIEKVLSDEGIRGRALALKQKFEKGFPESSLASLDGFKDFITQKAV